MLRPLRWLLALAACAAAPSAGADPLRVALDYRLFPNDTVGNILSVSNCGLLTNGTGLTFTQGGGLGLFGGSADTLLDGGESLAISTSVLVENLSYSVAAATNPDANGASGEHFVEATGAGGSLGAVPVSGVGPKPVAAFFGGAALSRIDLTAAADGIRIGAVAYDVPEGRTITGRLHQLAHASLAELSFCGLTIGASSGTVRVEEGAAVAGGAGDAWIDPGEELLVELARPLTVVDYELVITNSNGSGASGQHFVQAFDGYGHSLGWKSAAGTQVDLAVLYGGASLSGFVLAGVDQVRLYEVTLVPEPAAGAPAALGALAARALRRRRAGT
jgi:hypothetical protein